MAPTGTGASRWSWSGAVRGPTVPPSAPSMRNLGLQAAQPRAKARTTVPAQDLDKRPDLLRRDFTADEPGKKLCGDIPPQAGGALSYVRTWAGFIYLVTVLDC